MKHKFKAQSGSMDGFMGGAKNNDWGGVSVHAFSYDFIYMEFNTILNGYWSCEFYNLF